MPIVPASLSSEANCLVAYAKVWYLTGVWRKKTRNEPGSALRVPRSSPEYMSLPFMSGDAWKGMSGSPLARRAPSYDLIESAMPSDRSRTTAVSRWWRSEGPSLPDSSAKMPGSRIVPLEMKKPGKTSPALGSLPMGETNFLLPWVERKFKGARIDFPA